MRVLRLIYWPLGMQGSRERNLEHVEAVAASALARAAVLIPDNLLGLLVCTASARGHMLTSGLEVSICLADAQRTG